MHFYMITVCCLKSPSVVESRSLVQIEFRKSRKNKEMATSVHPDKFRGESLEMEKEQELSHQDKLKVRSKRLFGVCKSVTAVKM